VELFETVAPYKSAALNQLSYAGIPEYESRCKGCSYIKHFTKAVTLEVVARCPRCKSDQFAPA
jgi:Zn finger protein HypA/HybF involved in hydrogenase expression